jgi:hypothetical protein
MFRSGPREKIQFFVLSSAVILLDVSGVIIFTIITHTLPIRVWKTGMLSWFLSKAKGAAAKPMVDPYEEWRRTCAAMALAEQEAAAQDEAQANSCPVATCYWVQNFGSVTTEMPLRWTYHTSCVLCCYGLQALTCGRQKPIHDCAQHHVMTQQQYAWLAHFLCNNLAVPLACCCGGEEHDAEDEPARATTTWNVYKADYRLRRPPQPPAPRSRSDDEDCCNCKCSAEDCCEEGCCSCDDACCGGLEQLLNREIRSMLCLFSCASSLHPARCCGPAPCYESMGQRHERWAKEVEEAMDTRTAAFYENYDPAKLVFKETKHGLVAFRAVDGVVSDAAPAAAVAPAALAMERHGPLQAEARV